MPFKPATQRSVHLSNHHRRIVAEVGRSVVFAKELSLANFHKALSLLSLSPSTLLPILQPAAAERCRVVPTNYPLDNKMTRATTTFRLTPFAPHSHRIHSGFFSHLNVIAIHPSTLCRTHKIAETFKASFAACHWATLSQLSQAQQRDETERVARSGEKCCNLM